MGPPFCAGFSQVLALCSLALAPTFPPPPHALQPIALWKSCHSSHLLLCVRRLTASGGVTAEHHHRTKAALLAQDAVRPLSRARCPPHTPEEHH